MYIKKFIIMLFVGMVFFSPTQNFTALNQEKIKQHAQSYKKRAERLEYTQTALMLTPFAFTAGLIAHSMMSSQAFLTHDEVARLQLLVPEAQGPVALPAPPRPWYFSWPLGVGSFGVSFVQQAASLAIGGLLQQQVFIAAATFLEGSKAVRSIEIRTLHLLPMLKKYTKKNTDIVDVSTPCSWFVLEAQKWEIAAGLAALPMLVDCTEKMLGHMIYIQSSFPEDAYIKRAELALIINKFTEAVLLLISDSKNAQAYAACMREVQAILGRLELFRQYRPIVVPIA